MSVKPIPDGFHTVTPYLVVQGVPKLIDFLKEAFDATEIHRSAMADGTIMHAQVKIGDSMVMMGEGGGRFPSMPAMLYVYVSDVDAVYERALKAGATSVVPLMDQFYGDRSGGVQDPSGNQWWIATHKKDVSPEEMAKGAEAHRK